MPDKRMRNIEGMNLWPNSSTLEEKATNPKLKNINLNENKNIEPRKLR